MNRIAETIEIATQTIAMLRNRQRELAEQLSEADKAQEALNSAAEWPAGCSAAAVANLDQYTASKRDQANRIAAELESTELQLLALQRAEAARKRGDFNEAIYWMEAVTKLLRD